MRLDAVLVFYKKKVYYMKTFNIMMMISSVLCIIGAVIGLILHNMFLMFICCFIGIVMSVTWIKVREISMSGKYPGGPYWKKYGSPGSGSD